MASYHNLTYEQQQQLLADQTRIPSSVADITLEQPYEGPRDAAGRYHGKCGKIVLPGNIKYQGDFYHGRKHGIGCQTWPDGSSFCGEWVHGEAHGYGKLTLPSGSEYFGEVTGGVRNGFGVFRSSDGSRYFGSWKNGKRHGFGIEIGEDGTYTGEWLNNSHHGWGTMQFGASLNRYTGEWKHDTMEGVGSMVWVTLKDQNKAKKLWRRASSKMLLSLAAEREHHLQQQQQQNQARRGSMSAMKRRSSLVGGVTAKSIMLSSDDMQQYVGEWKNGCPDGNGELRRILLSSSASNNNNNNNKSLRSVPFEMGNHFQGTFKRGKRDGFGIQYFADGSAFQGTWQQNLKHGKGTMIRSDGTLVHVSLHNDTIIPESKQAQEEEEKKLEEELSALKTPESNSTSLNNTQRTSSQATQNLNRTKALAKSNTTNDTAISASSNQNNNTNNDSASNQINNNNTDSSNNNNYSSAPTTHVDISVRDICFSKSDERAVHITISLVFVALRHLFHVYVGMQSGCGNLDDIYTAQIHSKLPEGIEKRSRVKTPHFVSTMSEEVLRATPIRHLSDFDGTVQLAEAHAETILLSAAKAAQKAMRTVMIHEYRVNKYAEYYHRQQEMMMEQNNNHRRSNSPTSVDRFLSRDNSNSSPQPSSPPLSPVLMSSSSNNNNNHNNDPFAEANNGSMSPSHQDIMNKFLSWTNHDQEEDDKNMMNIMGNGGTDDINIESQQNELSKLTDLESLNQNNNSNIKNATDHDDNETLVGAGHSSASTLLPPNNHHNKNNNNDERRRATIMSSDGGSDHDGHGNNNTNNSNSKQNRHASIEELFGQYDGATNSATASNGTSSATGSAERRPLSTVMHLAGFISMLRDAEVLSPDMTALDVLDCLEPLLSRRAHVPGSPGFTWPAFVEAIVRVAHKKLALSAVFCAQDQLAGGTLGSRLHHFVKEYLYPLLRCIKDLEACPEASSIIGVEQLEIATSENTTFESLRKATLRQLRAMTSIGSSHHQKRRRTAAPTTTTNTQGAVSRVVSAGNELGANNEASAGNFSISDSAFFSETSGLVSAATAAAAHQQLMMQHHNNNNSQNETLDDLNDTISGDNTPRSISESSVFSGAMKPHPSNSSAGTSAQTTNLSLHQQQQQQYNQFGIFQNNNLSSNQQQQQALPSTFEEAILLLAKQVEATISVKKQIHQQHQQHQTTSGSSGSSSAFTTPVAKGMELLQSLCAGSWSQFPAVAQCEVIEKVRIEASTIIPTTTTVAAEQDHQHQHQQSATSSGTLSDFVEVWCVASRPHKHSTQIRLHLLLVQIVKQTSEVRFVGFVPSSVIERLCVQSKRDPEFFDDLVKRTLFMDINHSSKKIKKQRTLSPSSSGSQLLKQQQDSSGDYQQHHTNSSSLLLARRGSSTAKDLLLARKASTVSQGSRKSIVSSSSTSHATSSGATTQHQQRRKSSSSSLQAHQQQQQQQQLEILPDLTSFIAASASHQLMRGSRCFSTAPLIYFDPLKQLYLSCNKSLGPLVAACTFSGLFLYPGVSPKTSSSRKKKHDTTNKLDGQQHQNNNHSFIEPFPVSSIDVLRHCIHALFGIDPVTSTGGLFIDIKSNYTGYLSAGRKSIAGSSHSRNQAQQFSNNNNTSSNNNNNENSNNNNAVIDNADILISPDEAASYVMQALQTLSRNHARVVGTIGTTSGSGVRAEESGVSNSNQQQQGGNNTNNTNTNTTTTTSSALASISQQNNAKKFAEIAEAAKARAQQAIKSDEQRLMYHGDNWRGREQNRKQRGFDQLANWPLAASDLKLSFGEFVECIMIICGLCSKCTSSTADPTSDHQEQQEHPSSSSSAFDNKKGNQDHHHDNNNNNTSNKLDSMFIPPPTQEEQDPLAMTAGADIFSKSMIEREQLEMNSALQGVMRASRATVGANFSTTNNESATSHQLNNNNNNNNNTSHNVSSSTAVPVSLTPQQQHASPADSSSLHSGNLLPTGVVKKNTSNNNPSTTVSTSTFLLDGFLKNFLPTIQYFVETRSALPKLIPSYWSWAIVDAYHHHQDAHQDHHHGEELSQSFDTLKTRFIASSLKKRAASAGLFAEKNRRELLLVAKKRQEELEEKRNKQKLTSGNEQQYFLGRPLSPISFLNEENKSEVKKDGDSSSSGLPPFTTRDQVERQQRLQKQTEIKSVNVERIRWSELEPQDDENDHHTLSGRRTKNNKNTKNDHHEGGGRRSMSASRRRTGSPSTSLSPGSGRNNNNNLTFSTSAGFGRHVFGLSSDYLDVSAAQTNNRPPPPKQYNLDDNQVAEILDKTDIQKFKEGVIVDKLQAFYNRRHDEALRIRQEKEEEERIRQEALLLSSGRKKGSRGSSRRAGSSPGSASARSRPTSPNSRTASSPSPRSRRGGAESTSSPQTSIPLDAQLQQHLQQQQATRGQLLLNDVKKKKGYQPPKMAIVTKKITVGASSVDGSDGLLVKTVQNELKSSQSMSTSVSSPPKRFVTDTKTGVQFEIVDGNRKLVDDHRDDPQGGYYYDEKLQRYVTHPSSFEAVVKKGLLVETPPLSIVMNKIEEDTRPQLQNGNNNSSDASSKKLGKKNKMTSSVRRKSVSPSGQSVRR